MKINEIWISKKTETPYVIVDFNSKTVDIKLLPLNYIPSGWFWDTGTERDIPIERFLKNFYRYYGEENIFTDNYTQQWINDNKHYHEQI